MYRIVQQNNLFSIKKTALSIIIFDDVEGDSAIS